MEFPYHHAFLLGFDQILRIFWGATGATCAWKSASPQIRGTEWRCWKQEVAALEAGFLRAPTWFASIPVGTRDRFHQSPARHFCWYFLVKFKPMLTNYADSKMFISPSWALLWNDARHVSQEFVMSDISIISVVITQPSETSPLYLFNNAGKVKPKWHGCTRQKDYKHKKKRTASKNGHFARFGYQLVDRDFHFCCCV